MISDALNSHVYPVILEMTDTQQIPISHIYYAGERESEKFLGEKTLLHVCSTDDEESKRIFVHESSTEENESECVHKSVNKWKDANNEASNEEPKVTNDPFIKEPSYFNIFGCGKNILNKLDATCKRVCMATPWDKYDTEFFSTITDCNDRNGAPFSNDKIRYAIHRFIEEDKTNSHNVTVDTFIKTPLTPNEQGENENMILTSEKWDKLDALA